MYKNIKVEAEHNCGIYCLFSNIDDSSSKLKDYQVFEILELLNTKIKQTEIAKIYNVSKYCISLIKNNKSYKHIERCSNQ